MRADRHEPLPPEKLALWSSFGTWDGEVFFPSLVGLVVEEIRTDYCRMRLPYRPELRQPAGVVHGGAICTLLDTVVVPAVAAPYDVRPRMLTVTMNVRFRGAVVEEDVVAEGWIDERGRSTVFCGAEAVGATSGRVVADGTLVYKVSVPKEGGAA
jgi:uncharacterized protein (TIGR00369 family)